MKESEKLKIEAQQEDNDFRAMGKMKKAIRQQRLERFEDYIPKLEAREIKVYEFDGAKHTLDTQTDEFGIVDFFPKANKVLIRKKNKWEEHGLKWLVKNLLNENK